MSPQNPQNYNRVYAPILLGISVLIGIGILRPVYSSYLDTSIQYKNQLNLKEQKQKELDTLNAFRESFLASGATSDIQQKIKKIDQKWDAANVMAAITMNDFTRGTAISPARIAVGSISVNKGSKLVNGLSLGSVNFSVSALTVEDLITFITYLSTSQDSKFVFTIDGISLPLDTGLTDDTSTQISLSLSLGVYYFE
jgi:hypothetical protein